MNHFFCLLHRMPAVLFAPLFSRKNSTVYSFVFLCTWIIFIGCNSSPKSTQIVSGKNTTQINLALPTSLDKAESERLRIACEAWYDSVLKRRGFQGGIVVAKKGNIVFEAYNGNVSAVAGDLLNDSTSLHIASVSKTFTAMAILKLSQDGKCNIDEAFSKYFPTFNYAGVTILTLLNHRSGLPNYVHFMEQMGWDKKIMISNQDVLDFLITNRATMQNVGTPDKRFSYCNTNYALLALLVEKLSGKKFGDYLKETFFAPLGMKNTFVYSETDSGKVALSYDYRGTRIPMNFLDMVYGDKNIYSTPRDLLTWDRALNSGIFFNPQTLAEAYTPYSNEKPGIRNYGLGWRMNIYPSGKKMIYHNGWWHGNNAAFIRLLEDSATIIVLGNKYNRGIYHARDLAALFGNYSGDADEEENGTVVPTSQPANKTPETILPMPSRIAKSANRSQNASPGIKR